MPTPYLYTVCELHTAWHIYSNNVSRANHLLAAVQADETDPSPLSVSVSWCLCLCQLSKTIGYALVF